MPMHRLSFMAVVACAASVPPAGSLAQQLSFIERAQDAGLTVLHHANNTLGMEYMSAGGAVGDFNNDGWPDLFILGGVGSIDCLYINQGDGTFVDEAAQWGVALTHRGVGAAVADYNGDGWLDIYVTSHGPVDGPEPGHHLLYRNNGDGTFTDVAAEAGVQWTTQAFADTFSASFGDYDLDGDLDLAVAGWAAGDGNKLFRNEGDGTFTDATAALNYDMIGVRGFAPRFVDMNGDRYPELLWVADFFTSKYFINNGDGEFTEATAAAGVGLDSNGMGTDTGDFNGDGLLDWYVTSRISGDGMSGSGNMMYYSLGDHVYDEVSIKTGCNHGWWGWGAAAVDFDHDRSLDIVATNGFTGSFEQDPTRLFLNNGEGAFTQIAEKVGLNHTDLGRGLVEFDYDRDGDLDIVIMSFQAPLALFENQISGPDTNWVRFVLDTSADPTLAPNGIGALVRVKSDGVSQFRYVDAGTNYLSQGELAAHFGLGPSTAVDRLRVEWANGVVTEIFDLPANQTHVIRAGVGCPGDLDGDGVVGAGDLASLLGSWGGAAGDLDGDGATTATDLASLLGSWGPCP